MFYNDSSILNWSIKRQVTIQREREREIEASFGMCRSEYNSDYWRIQKIDKEYEFTIINLRQHQFCWLHVINNLTYGRSSRWPPLPICTLLEQKLNPITHRIYQPISTGTTHICTGLETPYEQTQNADSSNIDSTEDRSQTSWKQRTMLQRDL